MSTLAVQYEGKKKTFKVTTSTPMSALLEQACEAFALPPPSTSSTFALSHKRTNIDLSNVFRFTGIPQNATIDLVAAAGSGPRGASGGGGVGGGGGKKVRIACDVAATGSRLQGSFTPDATLWSILTGWVDEGVLAGDAVGQTAAEGAAVEDTAMVFMRQRIAGRASLEAATLRSLGLISGTAKFTLSTSGTAAAVAARQAAAGATNAAATASAGVAALKRSAPGSDVLTGGGGGGGGVVASAAAGVGGGGSGWAGLPEAPAPAAAAAAAAAGQSASAPPLGEASSSAVDATAPTPMDTQSSATLPPTTTGAAAGSSNSSSGSAFSNSMMDVSNGGPAPPPPSLVGAGATDASADSVVLAALGLTAAPPPQGLKTCQQALSLMRSSHFDSDSEEAVLTLVKYVDNILHRPGESKTRTIKCSNVAFQKKVGRLKGGLDFLFGLGFKTEVLPALSQEAAARPEAFVLFRLPPETESAVLLRDARVLLGRELKELGVPAEKIPRPPAPKPQVSMTGGGGGGGGGVATTFDPYKSFVVSVAPQPRGGGEGGQGGGSVMSSTEAKVAELKAQRDRLEEGSIPNRDIVVMLTAQIRQRQAQQAQQQQNPRPMEEDDEGGASDRSIVARHVASQMALQKAREDGPITTRAMRELESLKKAKVYAHTLMKVHFPDGVVLTAKFHPREKVCDVREVVQSSLSPATAGRGFALYVTPPRQLLKDESSLQDAGLVPAAKVYVSWEEGSSVPPGEGEGAYLKPEVLASATAAAAGEAGERGAAGAATTGAGAAGSFPHGVPLMGGADGAGQQDGAHRRFGSGEEETKGGGKGKSSGSGSGKKGKGRPSWLKL